MPLKSPSIWTALFLNRRNNLRVYLFMHSPRSHFKPLLIAFLLTGVGVCAGTDMLTILNGDLIHGRFEGLEGTSLQFKPLWAEKSIEIPAAYVGHLQLAPNMPEVQPRDIRLEFVSGQHLQGRLLDVKEETVILETDWGQTVTAKRELIHRLLFLPEPENMLFQGAMDGERWELGAAEDQDADAVSEGNLIRLRGPAHAGFSLPPLPEKMIVEFSVRNLTHVNVFNLELLAGGPQGRLQEGLSFMFSGSWLTARSSQPRGRNQQLFRGQLDQVIQEGDWVRFRFLCDLKTKQFQIWMNGAFYHTFHYETEEELVGKDQLKIRFHSRNQTSMLEISDVKVWKTSVSFPEMQMDALKMPGQEYLTLHNGDVLRASLTGIDTEWVHLRLPQGEEIALRRDRVDHITLQEKGQIQPKRRGRDVLLRVTGSSDNFTLRLQAMDADGLTGESEYFVEPLKIPPEFLHQVEFNIHQRIRFDREMQRQEPLAFLSLGPKQMDGGA